MTLLARPDGTYRSWILALAATLLIFGVTACGGEESTADEIATAEAPAEVQLETEEQKTIYALGVGMTQQIGMFNLSEEEIALVEAGVADGLRDASKVELAAMAPLVQAWAQARMQSAAADEASLSTTFVEEQATQPGAEKLDSGMVMVEITPGSGDSPAATSTVKVHYHGTLRGGKVFDSSVDRGEPVEFALNQVIPCWTEGLQRMQVGGKSRLVCPSALAYGPQGRPPQIPGNSALVFEVELLEITAP